MKHLFSILLFILILCCNASIAQNATFITINSGGTFTRVTIGAGGCTSTPLNLCSNFTGSPLSIALDGNILYIVDNKGYLYKNTLTTTGTVGNCTNIGRFSSYSLITSTINYYGLTVGPGGIVYAAIAGTIDSYNPANNSFSTLGTLPNGWVIGGDLLFYQGKLYEACKAGSSNILVEVNLTNVATSTNYMSFNAGTNVYGFASVTVPCANNQAYAVSTNGSNTDIYAVDMTAKTQATTATCTLPFKVNDAASLAETQSSAPPANPIVTNPFNICQGDKINFPIPIVGSIKDTLRWYIQASGGTSYGSPTPKVDSSVLGTTTYYVTAYDTSTGCETPRQTMIVSVNPYPAVPTITPKDSTTICTGTNATFTSSAATGNQWNIAGAAIAGATNTTYTTNIAGNYTVTATTNKGCSKTSLPVKLIVADTLKSTTHLSICQSQLPYTWNGLIFNTAGTQTKTGLKTTAGCDSSATLVLGMATAKNDTLNLFDCDSVQYKGVWYDYPTTIYDTLKGAGGCDSVDRVVNVEVARIPSFAYIPLYNDNKVIVINTETQKIVKSIIGVYGWAININHSGTKAYVLSQGGGGFITVIDTKTNTPVATINIGTNIYKLCVSYDDKYLFVTQNNIIHKIDASNNTIVNSFSTPYLVKDIAISNDNTKLIVSTTSDQIYIYDPTNFSFLAGPFGISGLYPLTIVIDNNSQNAIISFESKTMIINLINYTIVIYSTKHKIEEFALSPSNKHLYASLRYTDSIAVYDYPSNFSNPTLIKSGLNSIGLSVSLDEKWIYVCNNMSKDVTIIDAKLNLPSKTIPVNANVTAHGNYFTPAIFRSIAKDTLNFSSCSSITYKTKTYTTSTSFTDTTKSYRGCDSVYTLVNIVISNSAAKDTLVKLSSCQSITYKGITYTNSTAVLDTTIKTINGSCDSIYRYVQITIKPITPIVQTSSIFNCKTVVHNGITYTNSAIAKDTVKSVQGCDSIYHIDSIEIGKRVAYAYITNWNSGTVSVINTTTNKVVDTITVGTNPYAVCNSYNGKYVYITNWGSNTISVINTATNTVVANIPVGIKPHGIVINSSGTVLYVVNEGSNTVSVINAATYSVIATINVGNLPRGIAINSDGTNVYVVNSSSNNVSVISTATNTVVATVAVGANPIGACVLPNNNKLYVANNFANSVSVINTATNAVVATITGINSPLAICSNANGNNVYVTNNSSNTVTVINTATNTVATAISVGSNPEGISINSLTNNLYVANFTSNNVSVINANNNTVSSTITVGNGAAAFGDFITRVPATPKTDTLNLYSCKSIIYNSISYPTSTVLHDTLHTAQGCDSVYKTINISITSVTLTNDVLNYFGCKSYTYKNKIYTSSITLYDTLKSRFGCDSIAHLVKITIAKPAVVNETFLQDCYKVSFNSKDYYSSTFISDTIKNSLHCDSIINTVYINIGTQDENAYIPIFYDSTICVVNTSSGNQITDSINLKPYINIVSNFHPQDVSNDNKNVYILENVLKPTSIITSYNHFVYKINTTNNTLKKIALQNNIDSNTAVALKVNAANNKLYIVKYRFNNLNSKYYRNVCIYDTSGTYIDSSNAVNTGVKGFYATDNYNFDINKINGDVYVADSCNIYVLDATLKNKKTTIAVPAYLSYKYPNVLASHNGKYIFIHQKTDTIVKVYNANTFSLVKTLFIKPDSSSNKNLLSNIVLNSNDSVLYYTSFNNKVGKKNFCYTALDWLQDTIVTRVYYKDSTICYAADYNLDITNDNNKLYLQFQVCGTPKRIGFVANLKAKNILPIIKSNRKINSWQTSGRFVSKGFTSKKVNTLSDTITITHCQQVVVNGITYTSSKVVVKDTLKTAQGCDSLYHYVNVIIKPIVVKYDTTTLAHCNQVVYNGVPYTSSHFFVKDTTPSYQGCDSIYHFINIVIKPIVAKYDTTTLRHCNQVVYNGVPYTSSQIFIKDTTPSYQGCDSIYHFINIVIKPIVAKYDTTTLRHCNQVVYNGVPYTSSQIFIKDTTPSYQGCDSIYHFINIVIKPVIVKINRDTLSDCHKVVFNGLPYFNSTVIRDTIKSYQGCDSIVTITNINIWTGTLVTTSSSLESCDSIAFRGIVYWHNNRVIDTLKNVHGCDSIYHYNNIVIYPKPLVASNVVYKVLPNQSIQLMPNYSNVVSYHWQPATFLNFDTVQYPICTPAKTIDYKVTVYNAFGCDTSTTVRVSVAGNVVVPNAFSPNGDNNNDTWDITNLNTYPQNRVTIFDRGGQKLFESFPGSYKAWTGKYNGKDVPVGVYYYIIILDPSLAPLSGSVTVLR